MMVLLMTNIFRRTLVPAYDHPWIWEGHSSLIPEIQQQLAKAMGKAVRPDTIICSVGCVQE